MESASYFDARTCYEDGLRLCTGNNVLQDMAGAFNDKIDTANRKLAELNIDEAERAFLRGDSSRAVDHLELVKTLTYDQVLREKAEALLLKFSQPNSVVVTQPSSSSCSSCSSCGDDSAAESAVGTDSEHSLPLMEYYELLIQQLPSGQYQRYSGLGEDFAYAYVAASQDNHDEALTALEVCHAFLPQDIYFCEKGKLLHRLGEDGKAEGHLRKAVQLNGLNSVAWLNLALVLIEGRNFQDALAVVEEMIAGQILSEQALMFRAEIYEATGEHLKAVDQYVELLGTGYLRAAAEKLYGLLMELGRDADAAVIFKKYLNKSCH